MTVFALHPPAVVERLDTGVGPSAAALREALRQVRSRAAGFEGEEWRTRFEATLATVAAECTTDGWDGYTARPVQGRTFEYAWALASLLEGRVPLPDVMAHPDGDLALEWHVSRGRSFTVSIGPDGTLHYFGVFGLATSKGHEVFRDSIPEAVIDGIRRVHQHE